MSQADERNLILTNGLVMRRAGDSPERLDIVVRDGRIALLQPTGGELPAGISRLDVTGCLVVPGLVNAHYHSHDVLARGRFEDLPLEIWIALAILPPGRQVTAREVRLRTLIGAAENLRNGTTTVQDMLGCGPGGEAAVAAALAAYEEIGIRCVMSLQVGDRPAIDCLPGLRERAPAALHPLVSGKAPPVAEILSFVGAALANPPGPRLHWAVAPGSPQRCSLDLLAGLGTLARSHDLPLVTHVNESKLQVFLAEELYASYGGSVLDYLEAAGVLDARLSMAHGIWFSDAEIERIAASGAAVATCPASNLKLKNGIAPHQALRAAGIRLSLGCDNVSAGDSQNMFEAMRLLAWLNAGKGEGASILDANEVFRIATAGGAESIGLGEDAGSTDLGKVADLAVLDLSEPAYLPLNGAVRQIVYAESGRGVRHVLVDGRLVVKDCRLTTIDLAALAEETAELGASIRRDYDEHFERMAAILPHIRGIVHDQSSRPLPYSRWAAAGDHAPPQPWRIRA